MNYNKHESVLGQIKLLEVDQYIDIPRNKMVAINSAMVTLSSIGKNFSRILNKPEKASYRVTRIK